MHVMFRLSMRCSESWFWQRIHWVQETVSRRSTLLVSSEVQGSSEILYWSSLPTTSTWPKEGQEIASGKRHGRSVIGVVSDSPVHHNKRLFFVDGFLVGCGSAVSVIPPTSNEKRSPSRTEHNLSTANGQRLRTFGRRNARFIFLGKPCSHDMVVADMVHPILGMDFFQDGEGKRCIIDPRRRCLTDRYMMEEFPVDNKTSSVFSLISATPVTNPCHCESRELSNASNVDNLEFLWAEFPEITEPSLSNVVTMTVTLHIVTEGPPVYTPCRKLHGEKKTQIEEQLRQWERDNIIQRCESNWASPIHAVKKPDGSWRVCGDFRRVNAMTKLDRYPLPALTTFNEQLAGCTVFSKVEHCETAVGGCWGKRFANGQADHANYRRRHILERVYDCKKILLQANKWI